MSDKDEKKSRWSWLWPDVSTPKGKKDGINAGAVAAGWIAISYCVSFFLNLSTGQTLFSAYADQYERYAGLAVSIVVALIAAFLCWRIWKRQGHISASVVLIWTLVEVIMKATVAPGRGIVLSIIMTMAALSGVRGAWAYRRGRKSEKVDELAARFD